MDDARQARDDEFAEMELRILVALYDAWPEPRDVRLGEVYRPAGRYTGPSDAPRVITKLLVDGVGGWLHPNGLIAGKLEAATHKRLSEVDKGGEPRIARARAVIAEATRPVLGHASEVRDGIRG